jgi:hypothetical protein
VAASVPLRLRAALGLMALFAAAQLGLCFLIAAVFGDAALDTDATDLAPAR